MYTSFSPPPSFFLLSHMFLVISTPRRVKMFSGLFISYFSPIRLAGDNMQNIHRCLFDLCRLLKQYYFCIYSKLVIYIVIYNHIFIDLRYDNSEISNFRFVFHHCIMCIIMYLSKALSKIIFNSVFIISVWLWNQWIRTGSKLY